MSSARTQHEALLVKLHQEMKAERGDGDRAHELRDEMNALWFELTEDDRALFDELSEDLYIVENKRVVAPLGEGETFETVWQNAAESFLAQRDHETLAAMRKLPHLDARHAYVLGRCWERQGFGRSAVCFYDHAFRQAPKAVYAVSALEALVQSGHINDAEQRALEIENNPSSDNTLLLKAASVLHHVATVHKEWRQPDIYQRVVRMVESAWSDQTALSSLRASALLVAGFAYQHLQQPTDALRAFERAVAIYPTEPTWLAYGITLLKNDRSKAIRAFAEATRLGTSLGWPYLYVAAEALSSKRFAEAEKLCEAGLAHARKPELRARLYEWLAISAANLGRSDNEVRARFDAALAELPLDPTIRYNAAAYEEFATPGKWRVKVVSEAEAPTINSMERRLLPYSLSGRHSDAAAAA